MQGIAQDHDILVVLGRVDEHWLRRGLRCPGRGFTKLEGQVRVVERKGFVELLEEKSWSSFRLFLCYFSCNSLARGFFS